MSNDCTGLGWNFSGYFLSGTVFYVFPDEWWVYYMNCGPNGSACQKFVYRLNQRSQMYTMQNGQPLLISLNHNLSQPPVVVLNYSPLNLNGPVTVKPLSSGWPVPANICNQLGMPQQPPSCSPTWVPNRPCGSLPKACGVPRDSPCCSQSWESKILPPPTCYKQRSCFCGNTD